MAMTPPFLPGTEIKAMGRGVSVEGGDNEEELGSLGLGGAGVRRKENLPHPSAPLSSFSTAIT